MPDVRALQHTELDRFWAEFEAVMGGPDGLMTYRYLGTHAEALDHHHAIGSMALRSDLRGPHGLLVAPLAILIADTVGILDDAIAVPAPTQYDIEVLEEGAGVERVHCIGELYHEGRTQLFSRATVVDSADHDRVLALAWDAGVVVAPAPQGYRYVDPGPGVPDGPSLPPLWQAFGAVRTDDGAYQIPALTGRLGSTSGSLHHGPTQVVLEAAATEAAVAVAPADRLRMRHWHVTFTATGKAGPFVTSTAVRAVRPDAVVVEAELHEGATQRRVAAAAAVFDRR